MVNFDIVLCVTAAARFLLGSGRTTGFNQIKLSVIWGLFLLSRLPLCPSRCCLDCCFSFISFVTAVIVLGQVLVLAGRQ